MLNFQALELSNNVPRPFFYRATNNFISRLLHNVSEDGEAEVA